jgi:hypothetical protein
MMKRNSSLLFALLFLGCGSSDTRNPEFDRWCGGLPCEWMVEGDVERVGTWHTNDYAVQLVSDDAQLEQVNGALNEYNNCLDFGLVAKIDRGVRVFLELDFMNDGKVDFSQQLPMSDWDRLTFKITAPDWYRGVRFIVRKAGPGRAIVAELGASAGWGGCTAPPVELADRPAGAHCSSDDQCGRGACNGSVCTGCRDDGDCADDELCGLALQVGGETHACVVQYGGQFGSACSDDRQCESGVCANRACSECRDDSCADGQTCGPAISLIPHGKYWPNMCGPGDHNRGKGEVCTSDLDCESGECRDVGYACPLITPACMHAGCPGVSCAETLTSGGVCE